MQNYVETLISRRQPLEELEDKSIETSRLKESYNQFKLPKFNPIKLEGKKVEYKEEREFLLKFANLSKEFSINVTTEIEAFTEDIKRRQILVKELFEEHKNEREKLDDMLELIKKKDKKYQESIKSLEEKDSKIRTQIERITEKLRTKVSSPLTKAEEQLLFKIDELKDNSAEISKRIKNSIENFKKERQKEEEFMKDYKCKFTKEEMDDEIKPRIQKLLEMRENLKKFLTIIKK
jgi:hypothetical protein